ncbi:Ribonuclease h domain [Thalictrum thalictroides]|uniref:Ribonuclease h domain n=1 Tax=Thalictrum thalictroides TaxID=46969 RepID=A0A7J6VWZ2_THATH|nr:Ribonuclease h domain [Thalictrum thalictroides]
MQMATSREQHDQGQHRWCIQGNPGRAGVGAIFRDHRGKILIVHSRGIGITTNFRAEYEAIIDSREITESKEWRRVWVESDSTAAVEAFRTGGIPWQLLARWRSI